MFADEAAPARAPVRWPLVAGGVLAGVALSAAAWQLAPRGPTAAPRVGQAASGSAANAANAAKTVAPSQSAGKASVKPALKPATAPIADAAPGQPLVLASQDDAVRALAGLWGQALPGGDPCQNAPRFGLRCYQGRGGLYELRLLDRPAIVALHDGQKIGYALLSNLDADGATLSAGGRHEKVSLAALATRFDGEFTTLWKAPRAFRDEVKPGDTGPDVDWIAARLAQINKSATPASAQPLDEPTRRLLRAFQASQNLKADGVAGPRTYMRLNQMSGVDEPRLLALGK